MVVVERVVCFQRRPFALSREINNDVAAKRQRIMDKEKRAAKRRRTDQRRIQKKVFDLLSRVSVGKIGDGEEDLRVVQQQLKGCGVWED